VLTEPLPDERFADSSTVRSITQWIRWRHGRALAVLAPYAVAVLSAVFFFRETLLTGMLPGNRGDARWTVAIYEHWYEVWQGDETLRSIPYYFPTENTLGMSDAFFAQGQLHSLGRTLGLDHAAAWENATIGVYLLSALGLAFLSKLALRSVPFRCAFVALACLSYPVTVMMAHPQLIGFLSVSWIFAGALLLFHPKRGKVGVYLLIIITPVLVLSSWYAALLGMLTLLTTAAFLALLSPSAVLRQSLVQVLSSLRASLTSWYGWLAWGLTAALWMLAVSIYLPARRLSPASGWGEVAFYSPRVSDLLNASAGGGGVWGYFYNIAFDAATFNHERALGFTPLLLSALLMVGGAGLRRLAATKTIAMSWSRSGLSTAAVCVAGTLTVLSLAMITVVDERRISVFLLIWKSVPALDSIRAPFRIQLVLYILAIFVVVAALEAWTFRPRSVEGRHEALSGAVVLRGRWVVAGLLCLGILVEMQRANLWYWSATDLAPRNLLAQIPTVRNTCGAFVIDSTAYRLGTPEVVPAVDAVMLSMLAEVPTANGYSRSAPIGHPGHAANPATLVRWMRTEGYEKEICVVSPSGVEIVPATS
jgi:hypothetical protein